MQTLEDLKKHFIKELVHQDLRRVFYILRQNIDNQSIKYDDLNLLHARYITASHDQNVKGILPDEEARIIFNQIKATLLGFINELTNKDLNLEPSSSPVSIPAPAKDIVKKATSNKGKILYNVPEVMELKKECKCIVRIAFDEKELEINDRKNKRTKVEPIRIAEVMEVQFIDQSPDSAFNIRTVSSSEQLVDRGDFTEWIFYVKPLLEGIYELILKVSVIEKRLGREIRKDIVMEKKIEVVANPVKTKDSLGNFAKEETQMAAGAGFMIPAGFKVWDQPVILDSFLIPPLDPGVNPPTLPPPTYVPVNELGSISWLIVATVALIAVVAYFSYPESNGGIDDQKNMVTHQLKISNETNVGTGELKLTIKGNFPPFDLKLEKENDSNFSLPKKLEVAGTNEFYFTSLKLLPKDSIIFSATLIDSLNNQIVEKFPVHWKISDPNEPYSHLPLGIKVQPSIDKKSLDLIVTNGFLPFQITIINDHNKSQNWTFHLIKARDSSVLFQSLKKFPLEGNFTVEVADVSHKMASDNFSLTMDDVLTLKTKLDIKAEKLSIRVNGNRPPFKVFLDNKRIADLKNSGSRSVNFSDDKIKGKRKIEVVIKDAKGKSKTKMVKIPFNIPDTILDPFVIVGNDCLHPENYKDKCAIIYIFTEATPDNWRMDNKTFANSKVKKRIKQEKFNKFRFNLKNRKSDCNNMLFSNLKDANTFVFQGNNKDPISYKGYVDSDKLLSTLFCFDEPDSGPAPPILTSKGDGKSIKIQLDSVKTYKYLSRNGEDISIEKQQGKKYRVQIISFGNENVFDSFIENIENTTDIKEPLFIRLEDNFIKVYLGDYQEKAKADELLKNLKIYLKKNKIVTDDEYIKHMRVIEN